MKVVEFVNMHAATLRENSVLRDAVDKLSLYKETMLPVLNDEDTLIGLLTEQLVYAACFEDSSEKGSIQTPMEEPVTRWMLPPISIEEDADLSEARQLMAQHGLDCLPVVSQSRFIGTLRLIDTCLPLAHDPL